MILGPCVLAVPVELLNYGYIYQYFSHNEQIDWLYLTLCQMLVVPGYTVQDVELLHLFTVECVQYTPLCHMDNAIYDSNDQVKTYVTDIISLSTIV